MIGDALALPKRDIYVTEEHRSYNVSEHPWYAGAPDVSFPEECVIKSHELPDSPLHRFPMRLVHLVRDGRDVVVSKYFWERDFCVKNGLLPKFEEAFDDYVPRVAAEWNRFVLAWLKAGAPLMRYEEFLASPIAAAQRLLSLVGMHASEAALQNAVAENTKDKVHASLAKAFAHNTFVRKAVAGDWRNHFEERHIVAFEQAADEAMRRLGYSVREEKNGLFAGKFQSRPA